MLRTHGGSCPARSHHSACRILRRVFLCNQLLYSWKDLQRRFSIAGFAGKYERYIVDLCYEYLKRNERIFLFAMCEKEGDLRACENIYSQIEEKYHENVVIQQYIDIEQAIQLFADAKKVYATRFHAMILGTYFNKPTVAISYNEKIQKTIETYKISCDLLHLDELDGFIYSEENRNEEVSDCEWLKEEAKKQWDALTEYEMKKV